MEMFILGLIALVSCCFTLFYGIYVITKTWDRSDLSEKAILIFGMSTVGYTIIKLSIILNNL